jgi:hypothetical protein
MSDFKQWLGVLGFLSLVCGQAWAVEPGGKSVLPPAKKAEGKAELKPSLAVFGGMADTAEGRKTGIGYGVEGGWQPVIPMSVVFEASQYVSNPGNGTAGLTRTRTLAKVNYNFGGGTPVIRHSYLGIGAGPVLDNINHSTTIDLGIAPQLGFDIPLGREQENVSLGANANYMWVGGAKPSVFSLNGVVKYWF